MSRDTGISSRSHFTPRVHIDRMRPRGHVEVDFEAGLSLSVFPSVMFRSSSSSPFPTHPGAPRGPVPSPGGGIYNPAVDYHAASTAALGRLEQLQSQGELLGRHSLSLVTSLQHSQVIPPYPLPLTTLSFLGKIQELPYFRANRVVFFFPVHSLLGGATSKSSVSASGFCVEPLNF